MNLPPEKIDPDATPQDERPSTSPDGYRATWADRKEELRPYLGPAIAVLVLVLMGGVAGWRYYRNLTSEPSTPAGRAQELPLPAVGSGDEGRLAVLDRLIARQTELMRAQASVDPEQKARLTRLEEERAELRVRFFGERSRKAEIDAIAAEGTGQTALVLAKFEEALKWQREANVNRSPADAAEMAREGRLAARVDDLRAAGLQQTMEREKSRAERAEAAENWSEAEQAYLALRAAQATINERLPSSRLADPRALDRLDAAIASMKAADLAATVVRREKEADTAEQAGSTGAAATAIHAALRAQQTINSELPTSRYASPDRAAELEIRWQTLASGEGVEKVLRLAADVTALLRGGKHDEASAKVTEALAALDESANAYPRSRRRDAALRRQLLFLDLRRGELAALQQSLREGLLPLPGATSAAMWATEVPQRLFERLMNYNPSHQTGPLLPVECVSWFDAMAFCERAGWLLGRKVRLPEESEFRAALTRPSATPRGAGMRTGRHPRPVPAAGRDLGGFADLTGNVAEWLADRSPYTAGVAGGSAPAPTAGTGLQLVTETKTKRLPQIGFRFVVE